MCRLRKKVAPTGDAANIFAAREQIFVSVDFAC
jgi:hypothetical protein